ncbi:GNAT family N-acetyltransferase [Actinoplanes bogorensis]|uniref:GNAT family N-acetyltransferase n=1 Tax=Paractinoplanes bogorensis TaxID=1610840 RepID=A0ABS5YZ08_9ACTN|nr:GNAT family N-acetyltransferase [Actinoplanes bogorensis]MBU2667924.1 GNAT family N-acetyltransferase [Actinoplanes bogorensis]
MSVTLRPYGKEDLDLAIDLETDPRVMNHLGGPVPRDDAVRIHQERLAAGGLYRVIVDDDGTAAGIIAVWRSHFREAEVHELGIMLFPDRRSRGVAEAAIEQIAAEAKEAGIDRLHAFVDAGNQASMAGARKVGFTRGERHSVEHHGTKLDSVHWFRDL